MKQTVSGSAKEFFRRINALISLNINFFTVENQLETLKNAGVPDAFTSYMGSAPSVEYKLTQDCNVYRFLSRSSDLRRDSQAYLTKGTYVIPQSDGEYAKLGFAAVSRYALPTILPVTHIVKYELHYLDDIKIRVYTVPPMFGRAGGGVEFMLPDKTRAVVQTAASPIDPY